jgi:hypothetical protein
MTIGWHRIRPISVRWRTYEAVIEEKTASFADLRGLRQVSAAIADHHLDRFFMIVVD